MPLGEPLIISENFDQDFSNYFGLVHCLILPPNNLLFPVLPARINNKLVFTLCYECALNKIDKCEHSDSNRAFEGTWVSEEIKVALNEGYKILEIYSIWHWENHTYDLFSGYVDTFLKSKQQNSGFPAWCLTDEDKLEYINLYKDNEGVELDLDKIEKNEGKRTISKLMLNSLWGRYAMQTNKPQTIVVKNRYELLKHLTNDLIIVKDVLFYEHIAHLNFIEKKPIHQGGIDSNIAIGCFVTAYGRIKLYSEMKKLDKNLLYYDTDSIIFVHRNGEYEPKLGDYLGDLTSELDVDEHIVEFISAGPKNYGYKTNKDKKVTKIKGFTLTAIATEQLNYDEMCKLIKDQNNAQINVQQLKFKRRKIDWSICTEDSIKKYKQVYDKRILRNDYTSIPYGYTA